MPLRQHYAGKLRGWWRAAKWRQAVIDEAVLRILRQKLRFAQVGEPGRYECSGRRPSTSRPGA